MARAVKCAPRPVATSRKTVADLARIRDCTGVRRGTASILLRTGVPWPRRPDRGAQSDALRQDPREALGGSHPGGHPRAERLAAGHSKLPDRRWVDTGLAPAPHRRFCSPAQRLRWHPGLVQTGKDGTACWCGDVGAQGIPGISEYPNLAFPSLLLTSYPGSKAGSRQFQSRRTAPQSLLTHAPLAV